NCTLTLANIQHDAPNGFLNISNASISRMLIYQNGKLLIENSNVTSSIMTQFSSNTAIEINDSLIQGQLMLFSSEQVEQTIRNTTFNNLFWLVSGNYILDNCSFEQGGFLLINDDFPMGGIDFIANLAMNNSYCVLMQMNYNGNSTSSNSEFDSVQLFDNSTASFMNCSMNSLIASDTVHLTLNYSRVVSHSFSTPNLNIENSEIIDAAPVLEVNSTIFANPEDFYLNWTDHPGEWFKGSITNYTIYRAITEKNAESASDSQYEKIAWIENPNPSLPENTSFIDTQFGQNSSLDGKKVWYKVEIADQGNNRVNSSPIYTIFDVPANLSAAVVFNRELTTYDDIEVNIVLTSNDVNKDDKSDVDTVIINYTIGWITNNSVEEFTVIPTAETEGLVYNYTFLATYSYNLTFYVFINSTKETANVSYHFDSRVQYGDVFLIQKPQIVFEAFTPTYEGFGVANRHLNTLPLTLSINILNDRAYVKNVTLHYRLYSSIDPGEWKEGAFTFNESVQAYTFTFSVSDLKNYEYLEYWIEYYDVADQNTIIVAQGYLSPVSIYPSFPLSSVMYDPLYIILIITGSSILGTILGISYFLFYRQAKRESQKEYMEMYENLKKLVQQSKKKHAKDKSKEDLRKDNADILAEFETMLEPQVRPFTIMYVANMITLAVLIISSSVLAFAFNLYDLATFLMILAMISSLSAYVIWSYRATKYSIRKEKANMFGMLINLIHPLIFLIVVIYMLYIASNIPWVDYYIITQSGEQPPILVIGSFVIHSIYSKIVSIVFSSLIIFSITVYTDIRKSIKNIAIYKEQNANLSVLLYTKEELLRKTYSRINVKVIFVLVLLGVALMPISSDIMTIIWPIAMIVGPAFLIFLGFFLLVMFQPTEVEPSHAIFEPIKKCPSCGYNNVQSAQFCGNCKEFIGEEHAYIEDLISCPKCGTKNPKENKFCKSCGASLHGQNVAPAKKVIEQPKELKEPEKKTQQDSSKKVKKPKKSSNSKKIKRKTDGNE
ncbi:MAG: zinc ribbon domain-containing protein, partial [Candidatus Helarchaeales archaeon]